MRAVWTDERAFVLLIGGRLFSFAAEKRLANKLTSRRVGARANAVRFPIHMMSGTTIPLAAVVVFVFSKK